MKQLCALALEKGFAELMVFFEQKRAEVAKMVQAKEQDELSCKEQLQEEVGMLKAKTDNLEHLRNEQDDIHFLQVTIQLAVRFSEETTCSPLKLLAN